LEKRGFEPEDIELLRKAADPQVSADGQKVVFNVVDPRLKENRYASTIWLYQPYLIDRPLRQLLEGENLSLARWSPDSKSVAFVESEGKVSNVFIYPADGFGERIKVASFAGKITELVWSANSKNLAFVARETDPLQYGTQENPLDDKAMPARKVTELRYRLNGIGWTFDRPSKIFLIDLKRGGRVRTLVEGSYDASGISFSPDGSKICFVSARHEGRDIDLCNDVWIFSLIDGVLTRLTTTDRAFALPSWSFDGERIACFYNPTPASSPRHLQVAVIDVDTGLVKTLSSELDRNCSPFGSSRPPLWHGDTLIFGVEDHGNISLYQVSAVSDEPPQLLLGGDRWISDWTASKDALYFISTSSVTLEELHMAEFRVTDSGLLEVSSESKITDFTADLLGEIDLVVPQEFYARSKDGTEVQCWAMPPKGAVPGARYPVVLNVHGGPFTQYGNHLFDEFQLQSARGFGVLYCNPRGSSGYSEAWGRSIRWPECEEDPGSGWGGVDFEDVMACVEHALENFSWVDKDRLGVAGGSYGGYMTSWVIGHSSIFKAACSERACNNLLTMEHSADIAGFIKSYVGVSYLDDPSLYLRNSPVSYIKEIETPLLIVHSEEDLRCPINQAEELFVGLKLLGRSVEMVRFPGENHELSRSGSPKHRVERAKLFLGWFEDRLNQDKQTL